MERTADRYRRLAAAFAAVIEGVPRQAWSRPSPCTEWDARAVVDHVVATQGMFQELIGRTACLVSDRPEQAWAAASAQTQACLDDPKIAAIEFEGFFGRNTYTDAVARFLCTDLVVHAWDLGRATGQDVRITAGDIETIRATVVAFGEAARSQGAFGPELPVPPDADDQTALLALLGRRA